MKTVLITFFDIKGMAHCEFIPQGRKVNQAYYVEILKRLREAVHRKRPELWPNDWILHHDKAPSHKALRVKQFLAQKIHHVPLIGSEWLLAVPKNKVCLSETKISR
jgi:hypothetical protein